MSSKPKIRKLLSVGNCRNQNTQISRYFSQENNEHIKSGSNSGNTEKRKRNHLSEGSDGVSMKEDIDNCNQNNQNKQTNAQKEMNDTINKPTRKQRKTTITKFFNLSASDNDFETPKKEIKKAPIKQKTRRKVPLAKKPSKVKSTLHKTEEIFSEIIAQHSIEEHVNPMDLQMALAMSKSETEVNKSSSNTETNESCCNGVINSIGIKEKLQQYGFTTTRNDKDYDISFYMPGRRKVNWANKFTPLTLRNEERQSKKLEEKIISILNEQTIKTCNIYSGDEFTLNSNILKKCKSEDEISNFHSKENFKTSDYYVSKLFTPTKVKIGFLLKDYRKIPGRDESPVANSLVSMGNSNDDQKSVETTVPKLPLEETTITTESCQQNDGYDSNDGEYLAETLNLKVSEVNSTDCSADAATESRLQQNYFEIEPNVSAVDANSRALSPDLFDECEELPIQEYDEGELHISAQTNGKLYSSGNNELKLNSNNGQENSEITLADQYSTDEVKVSTNSWRKDFSSPNHKTQPLENSIDLTADSDSQGSSKNQSSSISIVMEADKRVGLSQISNTDDDCIIISDDEVNYSITVMTTAKKKYLRTGNCSDENICDRSKLDITNPNVSIMDILGENFDDGNISEESSDTENRLKSRSRNCRKSEAKRSLSFLGVVKSDHTLRKHTKSKNCLEFASQCRVDSFTNNLSQREHDISNRCGATDTNVSAHYWTQPDVSMTNINNDCFDNTTAKYKYESESHSKCLAEDMPEPKWLKRISNPKTAYRKTLSDSFITKHTSALENNDDNGDFDFSDLDEIDKLVYGSPTKKRNLNKPSDLDNLITGDMNNATKKLPEQFKHEGKVYKIRTENIPPKPDYRRMDSPTRLKELYKYGIKPLKKGHAVKILEFIYDQTHPRMIETETRISESDIHNFDKCSDNKSYSVELSNYEQKTNSNACVKFTDCFGGILVIEDDTSADVKDEDFIFQTNIRSKVPTAHVPLHLAWYNLVKSNGPLREALLHYEPIDLQQVYLYFKNLGFRYDPKDIKSFFDKRCILFRYDLSDGMNNRHKRKKNKALSRNT